MPIRNNPASAENSEVNALHLEQHVPADRGGDFDNDIGEDRGCNPAIVGAGQRFQHLRALRGS